MLKSLKYRPPWYVSLDYSITGPIEGLSLNQIFERLSGYKIIKQNIPGGSVFQ